MEKVRPWCGQPSDRGGLKNRTEQRELHSVAESAAAAAAADYNEDEEAATA